MVLAAGTTRRRLLAALLASVFVTAGCAPEVATQGTPPTESSPPIVFVHGNGDSSALWITTIWRFESNGYPRDRLFAIDLVPPTARDDDAHSQANRSSTAEARDQLAAKVDEVLAHTKATTVALVANSRGANTVRNYVKNGGGAGKVGWIVLGSGTNHGIYSSPSGLNSEFNGASAFMKQLNEGSEVVPGIRYLTIRSDKLDKYAQPELSPGRPSGIGYDAPELKGATNVVLEGADHRETAFSARAFAEMYRFLTGKTAGTEIAPESEPRLSGYIGGYENKAATNRGVPGVKLTVYELAGTSGRRQGAPVLSALTGPDGSWGPLAAKPTAFYEFVVEAAGQPVRHVFRSPFPRSSSYVGLRLSEDAPAAAGRGLIIFTRPRGYIAAGRDQYTIDGRAFGGVAPGVPTSSSFRIETTEFERGLPASLNGESLTVRAFLGEISYAEFHY